MIRIDRDLAGLRISRLSVDARYGGGVYLDVEFGGSLAAAGSPFTVPMSRDQAYALSNELLDVADRVEPGMLERRGGAYSYRLRR